MTPQIDLSGLKDIILPAKPPVWPLAVGWWIVIVIGLILILGFISIFVHHYFSPLSYAQRELKKLKKQNDSAAKLAKEVSKLLKRAAILRFSAEKVAALSDEMWERFLLAHAHSKIDPTVIKFIAYSTYLPDNKSTSVTAQAVYKATHLLLNNILKDKKNDRNINY